MFNSFEYNLCSFFNASPIYDDEISNYMMKKYDIKCISTFQFFLNYVKRNFKCYPTTSLDKMQQYFFKYRRQFRYEYLLNIIKTHRKYKTVILFGHDINDYVFFKLRDISVITFFQKENNKPVDRLSFIEEQHTYFDHTVYGMNNSNYKKILDTIYLTFVQLEEKIFDTR